MTSPYESMPDELEISHEYGEATTTGIVSTFPGIDAGDGQPREVIVRKPLP